jgi:hypothetical protein
LLPPDNPFILPILRNLKFKASSYVPFDSLVSI